MNQVLQPEGVRQDHLALARTVDDKGGVTGAGVYGSKIGGPVDGAMLLIPDPMGATGSTISKVIEQYGAETYGRPGKIIAVHLIITPEYLRHVTTQAPRGHRVRAAARSRAVGGRRAADGAGRALGRTSAA